MTRRAFSRELKQEAVELITKRGVSTAQASRDLGIHATVLRRWVRASEIDGSAAFPGHGKLTPEQEELRSLRREVSKLKAERDIPKKGRSLLRQGPAVMFWFVAKHRGVWPVSWMCDALGVSRSGFHAWLTRPRSNRSIRDEELSLAIRASFLRSDRTYGARRVWHDLLEEGYSCGLHCFERLMRQAAFRARPKRRQPPKDEGTRSIKAANVLEREFDADGPNQKWVADFTYIWTVEGWLYVAAVIDLFSRRVVGWPMSDQMTSQMVTDALIMAIWRRGRPKELLHHSDQGSQYTSEPFQRLMDDHGITCSIGRSGNVWDNAAMESFFSSLKTERIKRKTYRTRKQARADVFDYIECFYNSKRHHSTIGYLSPITFEERAMKA
ncbi:IS3 family transposase [Marinibacterium sp. SX1]|uniref:IS3 family transposase n=1 Tax=Marinibacterium sp. SX1 TaxID=3388424 RepID=UPI003D183F2D